MRVQMAHFKQRGGRALVLGNRVKKDAEPEEAQPAS